MEQKRTLWIIAAAGLFLLVVVGAALILYSPSTHKQQPAQASYTINDGWVNNPKSELDNINISDETNTASFTSSNEVSAIEDISSNPFEGQSSLRQDSIPENSDNSIAVSQPVTTGNVTVITDNANVIAANTTFDLNAIKPSHNVVAQNTYTENQMNEVKPKAEQKKSAKKEETKAKTTEVKQQTSKATTKTTTKSTITKTKPADTYWVQVSSYTSKKIADEARSVLESNKISSEVFTYTDAKGTVFFRVRVGPYTTKTEAEYWKKRIAMIDMFAKTESYIVNSAAKSN